MTDLVQKLVGALAGLIGCIDHGSENPSEKLDAARAALSEAKAGGWVAVPREWQPATLQAQPANVPDAKELHDRLMRIAEGVEVYGAPSKRLRASQLQDIARAILAQRPQVVPMTEEQIKRASQQAFYKVQSMPDDTVNGDTWDMVFARAVEAHHGITAPTGWEKQA